MRWLMLLLLPWLAGCASYLAPHVTPPPTPEHPRTVYILDHGRHSSLVLARADGSLMRYSYGDWRYYAAGDTGAMSTLQAGLMPTQGALGRRQLPGPADEARVRQQVLVWIKTLLTLQAEAERVDALIADLEAIYQQNLATRIYRNDYDLKFVHHPSPYHLKNNSNRMVAEWLIFLGAEVENLERALLSDWRLN